MAGYLIRGIELSEKLVAEYLPRLLASRAGVEAVGEEQEDIFFLNTAAPAEEPAPAADAPADAAPAEEAVAAEPGSKPEGYPSGNTVTFICSSSAGSATDVSARAFVDCFKIDDANVVVENISGGQQTVGTTEAVNRPADGMTVVMMAPSGMFGQPAMNPDLAYKLDDLRILANIAPGCYAIVCVKPGSPLSNADDFIRLLSIVTRPVFLHLLTYSGIVLYYCCSQKLPRL